LFKGVHPPRQIQQFIIVSTCTCWC
jgi:hypothetical protein